jgi:hypothetical protein
LREFPGFFVGGCEQSVPETKSSLPGAQSRGGVEPAPTGNLHSGQADHADGERIRPTIWPTPVLNEGDDLAFDILAVASPDAGAHLAVVIQT